jgi:glycosyltransferase involved in cell wall biosynthesis
MDSPGRRVLMLAFQFPPYDESTGSQRTLAFIRHLPALGWSPIVLTARTSAYPRINPATLDWIPPGTTVLRAFAFDIARTLSIKGIYPRTLCTPDRWNSWILGSIATGLKAVRALRPSALWATFPTPSAIAAGIALKRLTGLPLIGDLRDPMLYETWPETALERRVYRVLERALARHASAIVLTTPSACRLYRERYPEHARKFCTITNGMEPLDDSAPATHEDAGGADRPITLIHSGLMEMPDRDPTAFFAALRQLADSGKLASGRLRVVLRASGREAVYGEMLRSNGIAEIVEIAPRVSRTEAMREMRDASGLLLFQGKHCNRQIPAKAYEYLFMGKPIICLANAGGDTYSLVHDEWGVPYCADMEDSQDIARALAAFLDDHRRGSSFAPAPALRERHTRRAQAVQLSALLETVACAPATPAPG